MGKRPKKSQRRHEGSTAGPRWQTFSYGLTVQATTDEAYDFVVSVAKGKETTQSVATWIAARLMALNPSER